jgi:hypothetical protein
MEKNSNVIIEHEREIPIFDKTDVLVVGGGPAGIGAALAAARHGADVILLERYGYLGGMATGGYVVVFGNMGNNKGELIVRGIAQEIIEKLEKMENGVIYPPKNIWGSNNLDLVKKWNFFIATGEKGERIIYSPTVHPECLKILSVRLLEEAGVKLIFHAYACSTIVDNRKVKGIIFESKMGRMAILSRVTIDCTGDGDVFARAGADFIKKDLPVGLVFRIGGVDTNKSDRFIIENSIKFRKLLDEFNKENRLEGGIAGVVSKGKEIVGSSGLYSRTTIDSVVWFSNSFSKGDTLDNKYLTCAENTIREKALSTFEFYKKCIPGFENSFLLDTASQLGTRASRRLIGEHILTKDEVKNNIKFKDTIATCVIEMKDSSFINIPYGCLLPKEVDNLLVAGRSISTDFVTLITVRLIPTCILTGQAAGVAASLAVKEGLLPREINREKLISLLIEDNIYLA